MKTEKTKQLLMEQFKKTPIIEICCQKVGISRSSYYRWRAEDPEFSKQADEALLEGNLLINDLAESQLISSIKDRNMTGIIFWLKNRNPNYASKIDPGQTKHELDNNEIEELSTLLYSPNTFYKGQKLLTSYALRGKISEDYAQLILRIFLAQLKIEDIMVRKKEADIMSEVLFRNKISKPKKK